MLWLSETENRIQKFNLGHQLLKFYNWLFGHFYKFFYNCLHRNADNRKNFRYIFANFFSRSILQRSIQDNINC